MSKKLQQETLKRKIPDQFRFLRQWVGNPLKTGAVAPSSPALARKMASYIDLSAEGVVVELGPGTGVVTEAILERGIAPENLLSIEYSSNFVSLLKKRFDKVNFVQGDAYDFKTISQTHLQGKKLKAVVSSLPLFTQPKAARKSLIGACLDKLEPGTPFIQFSYALVPPVPQETGHFDIETSNWLWGNVPPARVWLYTRQVN